MTQVDAQNILLVLFDSLSEKACSEFSNELTTLSKLRKNSTNYLNAYAPSPESGPAQASLFTGLDMAAHGVWTTGVALPDYEKTLPERFFDHGHRTWLVGRRHLAGVSNWTTEHARPYEYANFEWAHGPLHRSRQNAYLNWFQETAPEKFHEIFPAQADPDNSDTPQSQRAAMGMVPDEFSFNHWVGARVCEHLSGASDEQPFFGIASFVVGETMGTSPDPERVGESLDSGALRQADAALGSIFEQLVSQGLADNTQIIVTATRGSVSDGDAQQNVCEEAIKVPLMIQSKNGARQTIKPAVSTMDIAPTLYQLAQIPPPLRLHGANLLADGSDITQRGCNLSRLRNPEQGWKTALCTEQWKLIMSHGDLDRDDPPSYSLFDLHLDPSEINNLATDDAHQDILDEMIDLMIDARVALEDRTEPRIANF